MENITLTGRVMELHALYEELKVLCINYACRSREEDPELDGKINAVRNTIIQECSRPVLPLNIDEISEAALHGPRRFVKEVAEMAHIFVEAGGRVIICRASICASMEKIRIIDDIHAIEEFFSTWIRNG